MTAWIVECSAERTIFPANLLHSAAISGGDCASERVQGKEGRGKGGGEKGEGNRLELFIVSVFGSEIDSFSFLKF